MTRADRGATIVIVGLTMVVLMAFAALAIDYGAATNERRRAQTAADAAALAGGGMLLADHSRADAVDDAIAITYNNLDPDISPAAWRDRWQTDCADPDRPAGYVASTFTQCISFNTFGTRVRVKLPTLTVPTSFARAIGIDGIDTTAFAEAELVPMGFGRVLPFAVPAASGGATELCLKSGQKPDDTPPCSGPDEGNFGSIDISLYGNPAMGTPEICGNTSPNLKLGANIILGTDHPLDEFGEATPDPLDPSPETVRNDHTLCPDLGARPNELWAQTGVGSNLDPGLIAGIVLDGRTLGGRLTLGPEADRDVRNGAASLDDRPLWEYIPTSLVTGVPTSCLRSSFVGPTATKAQMALCLDEYRLTGSVVELFIEDSDADGQPDILATPRFGFAPLFHPHVPSSDITLRTGTDRYRIAEFLPVFLQTTYLQCNPGGCAGIFDPGEVGSGLPVASNKKADALTALLLPRSTLPPVALSLAPGGAVAKDLALRR
ncbi:MAG: pilus assembly protein TadG-related protein [Acidimicrobiales bacterium]